MGAVAGEAISGLFLDGCPSVVPFLIGGLPHCGGIHHYDSNFHQALSVQICHRAGVCVRWRLLSGHHVKFSSVTGSNPNAVLMQQPIRVRHTEARCAGFLTDSY